MSRPGSENFRSKADVTLAVAKPKKKRVRRARADLEFLRHEARKLDDEVAQRWEIQGQRLLTTFFLMKARHRKGNGRSKF